MAQVLGSTTSDYGQPYITYSVDVSLGTRTPTNQRVTVTVYSTVSSYSSSYLGTGNELYGYIYINGWHTIGLKGYNDYWGASSSHSASATFDISRSASDSSLGDIYFYTQNYYTGSADNSGKLNQRTCSGMSITNVSNQTNNCTITAGTPTQANCSVTVSSLPSVSYSREIRWYLGSTKVATTTSATGTSYSHNFTGLLPNTNYTLKADIYSGDTYLANKTVNITTPGETGSVSLTASTTYINVSLTGMFNGPNYTRSIDIYYKRSTDASYTHYSTIASQSATASTQITGLVSGGTYSVYAVIKNGNTALKTTSAASTTTEIDTSLVPMPNLTSITQPLGLLVDNKPVVDVVWMTNKQVAGTSYVVMMKVDTTQGEGSWETIETMTTNIVSPIREKVTFPQSIYEGDVSIKIVASNPISVQSNTSNVLTLHAMDVFIWDNNATKTQGQSLVVTANEWNRLWKYVEAKSLYAGIPTDISKDGQGNINEAVTGSPITADKYNKLKNAISKLNDVGYADRVPGDEITAACIEALKTAINKH